MEAVEEKESGGLLEKVLPPRLEDAGLEDCALSSDSIQEAFLKAASAVKSRAATLFHSDSEDEPSCVQDPWPDYGRGATDEVTGLASPGPQMGDDVVVKGSDPDPPGHCVEGKVGDDWAEEGGGDKVVVGGDRPQAVGGRGCVEDGLKGLKIGEKDGKKGEGEEEDEKNEKPILVEGYV